MEYKKYINRLHFIGSFVIFGLAFILHFLFEWTNYNEFVGAFSATNESIFQHIKMVFYCVVIYYFISYFIFANKFNINIRKYMFSILISFLLTSIIVVSTYYVLKEGFSVESAFVNIASLLIGLFLSSLVNIHINNRIRIFNIHSNLSLVLIFVFAISLTYLHFNPLHTNFFYDIENQTYDNVIE